ncbi:hypothetical protein D9M69_614130 [compost metagenome]
MAAEATGQSVLLKKSSHITRPIIIESELPRISGITYSPTLGMNTSSEPATIPRVDSGRVMVRKLSQALAPRSWAASSRRMSIFTRCA